MDAAHCGTGTGTRARSSHDAALGSVSSFLCSVSLWPRPRLLGGSHCRCCCSPSSSFLAVAVPSVLLFHGDFQQLGARDFQWGRGPPTRFLAPEEPLRNRVVFPCWRMEKRPGDRGVLDLQRSSPQRRWPPSIVTLTGTILVVTIEAEVLHPVGGGQGYSRTASPLRRVTQPHMSCTEAGKPCPRP